MKNKMFKKDNEEKSPEMPVEDGKYYKGMDSLQRAQTILDEIKVSMTEFGQELDEVAKKAAVVK